MLPNERRTTEEVAALLGVSVSTAESHRSRIMEKLDIHETASLVRYAIRKGLIAAHIQAATGFSALFFRYFPFNN
jgi:hypothetical protein